MISSKLRDMNLVHLNRLIRKKVHGANTVQKASILLKRVLVEFIFIAFKWIKAGDNRQSFNTVGRIDMTLSNPIKLQ